MGNFSCTCSTTSKEEVAPDSRLISDLEEIVEFQPEPYKAFEITNPCLPESKQSTVPTDNSLFELQGELFRVQKSSKEVLVPRWCVLCQRTFRYFKNQYSSYCGEKPLFEILVKSILRGKAYRRNERLYLEISFNKGAPLVGVLSEPQRAVSENCSKRDSKNSSFSSLKLPKLNFASENLVEVLGFVVNDRDDWEKWSKGLLSCIKNNISMH